MNGPEKGELINGFFGFGYQSLVRIHWILRIINFSFELNVALISLKGLKGNPFSDFGLTFRGDRVSNGKGFEFQRGCETIKSIY